MTAVKKARPSTSSPAAAVSAKGSPPPALGTERHTAAGQRLSEVLAPAIARIAAERQAKSAPMAPDAEAATGP